MSLGRMLHRQLSEVAFHVFLTGVNGASDRDMLLDAKITHVLNMAEELESLQYPAHIHVRFVALKDCEDQDLLPHLDELVDHIHQVVSAGGYIVVHCVAGVSRSASACIAYLIKHQGMTLRQAHDHVKEVREVISPNIGFWAALIDFEMKVRGSNTVELMPFITGLVPSVDSCLKENVKRMKLGWMDYVFANIAIHTAMLVIHLFCVYYFSYDFQ